MNSHLNKLVSCAQSQFAFGYTGFARWMLNNVPDDLAIVNIAHSLSPIFQDLQQKNKNIRSFCFPSYSYKKNKHLSKISPLNDCDFNDVPIYLAEKNRDVIENSLGYLTNDAVTVHYRLRSIDNLFGHLKKKLLLISDIDSVVQAVKGAQKFLSAKNLIITWQHTRLDKEQDSQVLSIFHNNDYYIFDSHFVEIDSYKMLENVFHLNNTREFFAIPSNLNIIDFLAYFGKIDNQTVSFLGSNKTLFANGYDPIIINTLLKTHNKFDGQNQIEKISTVNCNSELICNNFYPEETDGNGSYWRWTGPQNTSYVVLPVRLPGRYQILINIITEIDVDFCRSLTAFILDQHLKFEIHHHNGVIVAKVNVDISAEKFNGFLEMSLKHDHSMCPENDSRYLGLCISSFTIDYLGG